jgi:condensin complex subunit 3
MFLRHLLKGIDAKEKFVRLRVCQLIALAMNSLGEIEFAPILRLMIATIYSTSCVKVSGNELVIASRQFVYKPSSPLPVSNPATTRKEYALQKPSSNSSNMTRARTSKPNTTNSSEVRRAVLFNLEQTRQTILFIIERARDVDAINRRCIYSRSMNEVGDFRILSIGNRERILRWGLRDRDPNTKKAAVKMFAHKWVEQANNNVLEVTPFQF